MSQRDYLRRLDATIVGSLARLGLADTATYDGSTACTVVVDRAAQVMGSDPGAIVGTRTVIRLQLREIARPTAGKRVRLTGTGEEFELREELDRDDSLASWVVVPRA
jgi:hypothetical protein